MSGLRLLIRWPLHSWLHNRCLRRIAALEQALGLVPVTLTPQSMSSWAHYLYDLQGSVQSVFPAPTNHVKIYAPMNGAWASLVSNDPALD